MNHLIERVRSLLFAAVLLAAAGCGDSNAEKLAKEKEQQRIEAEKQAMRDLQKSNQAVSDISKKIGRKVEPMDLGIPAEKKADPPAEPKK